MACRTNSNIVLQGLGDEFRKLKLSNSKITESFNHRFPLEDLPKPALDSIQEGKQMEDMLQLMNQSLLISMFRRCKGLSKSNSHPGQETVA